MKAQRPICAAIYYLRCRPELSRERVDLEASDWRASMIDLNDPCAVKHISQLNRRTRLKNKK